MGPIHDLLGLASDARRFLQGLQALGMHSIPAGSSRPQAKKSLDLLEAWRKKALGCRACRLCERRTHVVFGEGSPRAQLMFIGEGPGMEEDLQGRPFVGQAGKLLTKIIEAMNLARQEVYITNIVKCRPPNNRPPEPDEVASCSPYLAAQGTLIHPKVICLLGKTAAFGLLGLTAPISQLRGKVWQWQEIPVVVTFHPAYLLRNPSDKPLVWRDMKLVLKLLKAKR